MQGIGGVKQKNPKNYAIEYKKFKKKVAMFFHPSYVVSKPSDTKLLTLKELKQNKQKSEV